ncbi:hypothetical protein HDU83_001023 [Entophlyctis luteolus]|nr:hypothetical protein HDU83_001023 [Entophlyctis luteolus]
MSSSKLKISNTPGSSSSVATSAQQKKTAIRSSIDLELQLGFEKNPLDKPSTDFRDAESWFSQAKQTAEKSAAAAEKKNKRGGSSRRQGRGDVEATGGADDEELPYVAPEKNGNSFFRSSFFGGIPANVRTLERKVTVTTESTAAPSSRVRPMGPRGINSVPLPPQPGGTSNNGYPLDTLTDAERSMMTMRTLKGEVIEIDPADMLKTPAWYLQLRVWVYGLIAFSALIGGCIMLGLMSSPVAPSSKSTIFWIVISAISVIVAIIELIFFLRSGAKMLYHYDSPFLMLIASTNPNSTTTKTLSKHDLTLPIADLVVHVLLTIFWIITLADIGTAIGGCRTEILNLSLSASVCTGFEAVVSFGVISILSIVFATGMKGWETYSNFALMRNAV